MRIAVFSDVHGNLPALEAFLAEVGSEPDGFLCLGDVVDYGPWNDECLERIAALPGIVLLEGNHERLFLDPDGASELSPLVRDFLEYSRRGFKRPELISGLPREARLASYTCVHTLYDRKIFADMPSELDRDYMVGHSHSQFFVRKGRQRIANPGSVGQNRRCLGRAEYAIFDDRSDSLEFGFAEYDDSVVLAELIARGYPPACVDYYRAKSRPL